MNAAPVSCIPYQRILIPSLSACPSLAQLNRGASLAVRDRATVQVMQIIDSQTVSEAAGSSAARGSRRLAEARKRLDIHLARSRLSSVFAKVLYGEPGVVLAAVLREWQPDLVIVCPGQERAHWVKQALAVADMVTPDILAACP